MEKGLENLIKDFRISKTSPIVLMFDYDGTLLPLQQDIQQAYLDKTTLTLLEKLVEKAEVGLVTGRGLSDIKKFVPLKGIFLITNHGHIIEHQKQRLYFSDTFNRGKHWQSRYDKIFKQMNGYPNFFIEQKELCTTFYYGNVAETQQVQCKNNAIKLINSFFGAKEVVIKEGKKMIELLPTEPMDKGLAIEFVLNRIQTNLNTRCQVVFIGDDQADEAGFQFLNTINQFSVKVGPEETTAKYRLQDVDQVRTFLENLVDLLEHR